MGIPGYPPSQYAGREKRPSAVFNISPWVRIPRVSLLLVTPVRVITSLIRPSFSLYCGITGLLMEWLGKPTEMKPVLEGSSGLRRKSYGGGVLSGCGGLLRKLTWTPQMNQGQWAWTLGRDREGTGTFSPQFPGTGYLRSDFLLPSHFPSASLPCPSFLLPPSHFSFSGLVRLPWLLQQLTIP